MLSFDELKEKLNSGTQNSNWLHVYVDRSGSYWIRGYGGMGTTIFKKLGSGHPFIGYIETLLKENYLKKQFFCHEHEAGEDLARLLPRNIIDPKKVLDKIGN